MILEGAAGYHAVAAAAAAVTLPLLAGRLAKVPCAVRTRATAVQITAASVSAAATSAAVAAGMPANVLASLAEAALLAKLEVAGVPHATLGLTEAGDGMHELGGLHLTDLLARRNEVHTMEASRGMLATHTARDLVVALYGLARHVVPKATTEADCGSADTRLFASPKEREDVLEALNSLVRTAVKIIACPTPQEAFAIAAAVNLSDFGGSSLFIEAGVTAVHQLGRDVAWMRMVSAASLRAEMAATKNVFNKRVRV